jgi:hypothetical protein
VAPASSSPSWHVSPVGGLRVSGPWRMDRHVIAVGIVGGARLDLSQAKLAAREVTLTKVSLVGGTRVEAGPQPGPGAPTVHIRAFSLVGGVRVRRSGTV